jgi:ABC-type antimicrobial peptide transport system permease subunit
MRTAVAGVDKTQPVSPVTTVEDMLADSIAPRRFTLFLLGTFAAASLLLALIGIYGVIAYSVSLRTREIGVRMALGATQSSVQIGVIWKTFRLALIGLAVGMIASLLFARLIASLLFQTAPTDPLTFVAIVALLGVVALLAGYVPARRASKINPMAALRTN